MNESTHFMPMMDSPGPEQGEEALRRSRAMFQRTLSNWACDLLKMRHLGLDQPIWTTRQEDELDLAA